jgi:hypothetical protein
MSLHFESERARAILNDLQELATRMNNANMLKQIAEMRELYEDMVQPRDKAEINISGALKPLLHHEIKKREYLARGRDSNDPLIQHWNDEIQDRKDDIEDSNRNKKFSSGVFFTLDQIDELSKDEMDSAKRIALKNLSRLLKQEIKDFVDPVVKDAKSAKDLGITFGSGT